MPFHTVPIFGSLTIRNWHDLGRYLTEEFCLILARKVFRWNKQRIMQCSVSWPENDHRNIKARVFSAGFTILICFHQMRFENVLLLLNVVRCPYRMLPSAHFVRTLHSCNDPLHPGSTATSPSRVVQIVLALAGVVVLSAFQCLQEGKEGRSLITKAKTICDDSHSIARTNSSPSFCQPSVSA